MSSLINRIASSRLLLRVSQRAALIALLFCMHTTFAGSAFAHSVWLLRGTDGSAQLVFGEGPNDTSAEMLDLIEGAQLVELFENGALIRHELTRGEEAWTAAVRARDEKSSVFAHFDYGIMERDKKFLLRYFAKSPLDQEIIDSSGRCGLDLVATTEHDAVLVRVRFHGQPAEGATVVLYNSGGKREEATADGNGNVRFPIDKSGEYWVRARHVQAQAGTHEGEEYEEIRNYCTALLTVAPQRPADEFPDLPSDCTSFGAAVSGGYLYVYGGHTGRPHRYSRDDQSGEFRRLHLASPTEWETLPSGPKLQGLALVAHNGMVYRLGGFTALNKDGEDGDLHSQDGFARFDPILGAWQHLDPMPTPRSSFDAVVIGDHVYVVGGWHMTPDGNEWHTTALVADLREARPQWSEITNPPFHRRALSVGEHHGKLVAVGGMREEGGPTKEVSIFDPETKTWSEGPELLDAGRLAGFGSSSFQVGGKLYATGYDGTLMRLTADSTAWEKVGGLGEERFFHRMLPLDDERLLVLGGASMTFGSYSDVVALRPGDVVEASFDEKATDGE